MSPPIYASNLHNDLVPKLRLFRKKKVYAVLVLKVSHRSSSKTYKEAHDAYDALTKTYFEID